MQGCCLGLLQNRVNANEHKADKSVVDVPAAGQSSASESCAAGAAAVSRRMQAGAGDWQSCRAACQAYGGRLHCFCVGRLLVCHSFCIAALQEAGAPSPGSAVAAACGAPACMPERLLPQRAMELRVAQSPRIANNGRYLHEVAPFLIKTDCKERCT